ILFAYTGIILISLITIGIIFLVSLLFNNIKVPIVLIIIGGISSIYTIWNIVKSLDDTSIIRNNIYDLANYIFNTITGFTKNNSGYDPSIIGNFITLLGIAVLLFVLIRFIAENFSNDIYDNVFSFKISRILSYISILLFIGMIISGSIGILADLMYQPASEVYSYQDRNTALARIRMGAMVLTALISIRLTSKAMTKINEIF
ncbi:MAG: hypothetical protein RR515_03975, partial [Clostridium sp.]